MRYLVLSDIHANLDALDAVLAFAKDVPYDEVLVLGDLVGYGAEPNEVIARVRELQPRAVIRGNHDKVGAGLESAEGFNAVARVAIQWTHATLSPAHREWLAALPEGPIAIDDLVEICHGTPYDEDVYVFDDLDALRSLHATTHPLCLFGHTHVQIGYELAGDQFTVTTADDARPLVVPVTREARALVNPGSVGQPRDTDPRAGFAIVDTESAEVTVYRVEYAVESAQAKILDAGLPEVLAHRLAIGR